MADGATAQRTVPGAPPPAPLSKSQKKKRKSVLKPKAGEASTAEPALTTPNATMATLVEKLPEEEEIKKSAIAEELIVQPEQVHVHDVQDKTKKASPAVELLNKRIKAQTKKLSRIAVYSSKPPSELNEDQLKSVATLPAIQGAVRELEETRKAVEALEAEEEKKRAKQRAEDEKEINERISRAASEKTHLHQQRLCQILSLLRLSSLLSDADPTTFTLVIDEKERQALHATVAILQGSDSARKDEVANGLLLGDGNMNNVTYGRLLEIAERYRSPPPEREPTLTPTPEIDDPLLKTTQVEQAPSSDLTAEPSAPVVGESTLPVTLTGSFHFMQESELESTPFDQGAEWVEKPEEEASAPAPDAPVPELAAVIDTGIPLGVNGLSRHTEEEPPPSAASDALDWAADDADGLPSINSLHAKFGTPGDVTPEAAPQDEALATPPAEPDWSAQQAGAWAEAPTGATSTDDRPAEGVENWGSTVASNGQVDEEGFVKAKSSRGRHSEQRPEFRGGEQRGRGRASFRGDRGGYRGRGGVDSSGNSWRGGDGEFRGRGGFRGDRGRGGDFRGRGGRGGEFRGRGRGDRGYRGGRGGFDGNGEQGERQSSQ